MSGPVVFLALLTSLQITSSTYCNYRSGLIDAHLAAKDNLYCFDGGQIEINEHSKLCSDEAGFQSARQDDMSVLCAADYKLVGYNNYPCDDSGVLAPALAEHDTLVQYSKCVADADVPSSVCTGVNVAAASKLLVDQAFSGPVDNVDLVAAPEASDVVYYPLACDDGYGFLADVEGPVYGYCSSNSDGNVLSLHAESSADGCYELCPTNPTTIEEAPANFDYADIADPQRSGSTVSADVVCNVGFAVAHDELQEYEFSCTGLKEGNLNEGKYSCGENCPVCLAGCPASPPLDQITNSGDVVNLATVAITEDGAPGQTVLAGVTCGEGFNLGKDAPLEYDFICASDPESTAANSGLWTIVNDLPECKPICGKDKIVDIVNVDRVIIAEDAGHGQVIIGDVVCDDGYGFEFSNQGNKYEFRCGEGEFGCVGDCPVCYRKCSVPAENENFAYSHTGDEVLSGQDVELECKNDSYSVVGARFMVCNEAGELVFDGDDAYCADSRICESPSVVNGRVDSRNNLQIGDSYAVSCKSRHWFDAETASQYGDDTKDSFFELLVACEGESLPEFTCYFGCLAPDFAGGVTYPDMSVSGSAPFEMGAMVTFSCLDGAGISEGDAEATCDDGNIASPICGACSFTLSLFLAASLLSFLL